MTKTDETVHVTGATQEEINASFLAAKRHYTPAGAKAPSKGVMNRLYKEASDARAKLAEADATVEPAGYRPEAKAASSPKGVRVASSTEVEEFLADREAKPRSAADAKAQQEQGKVVSMRRRVDRNRQAEQQAADRVDQAVAEAKASADDPYRTAMRNRQEADRKRGPGRRVSDEDLVELIKGLVKDHPEYRVGQVWEVCMWTEKLAISKGRFDEAWRKATGTEPVRRPMSRKAG